MSLRPNASIQEIAPFAVPDYWDGNVLSVDTVPHGEFGPATHRREAKATLEHKITSLYGRDYRPLQRFGHGQTFDANEFNPGTVIRMRHECIFSSLSTDTLSRTCEAAQQPSANLSQQLGQLLLSTHGILSPRGILYERNDAWGVIMPGNSERHTLFTVPDAFVRRSQYDTRIVPLGIARFVPSRFEVGAVLGRQQLFGSEASSRKYQRVIAVDEAGLSGYKKPQPIKALVEKIVAAPALRPIPVKE